MTAGYLFLAERKIGIAKEEGDQSQLAKALEESELEAGFDGHNWWEDIGNCCSFVRPFPLIVSMPWVALAEMAQTQAADGKGVQVVPAVGLLLVG